MLPAIVGLFLYMIKRIICALILTFLNLCFCGVVRADENGIKQEVITKGRVVEILFEGEIEDVFDPESLNQYQVVKVRILEGNKKGEEFVIRHGVPAGKLSIRLLINIA